ncbi:hypothetical protein FRAHR75_1220002 [Frankia sp. Hr75.2]|nr:hypothetical protein FRAHR75_1220002 [Frankia sp. Hr75.2]
MALNYGTPSVVTIPTVLTERLMLRGWQAADLDPYAPRPSPGTAAVRRPHPTHTG